NEVVLYREDGDDRYFGDIVYANPGAFYGYFVANYQTAGGLSSQIKRVPLTGGPATVIANSPAPLPRDLVTDGTSLFSWDAGDDDRAFWGPGGGDLPRDLRRQRRHLGRMGRLTRALVGLPTTGEHQLHDQKARGGITRIVTSGQVGVGHLQWDATSIYWGDVS